MTEEEGEEEPLEAPEGVRVGLCASCSNAKTLETKIGATIYLCSLAAKDARFRRFPLLPMVACEGFERRPDQP